MKYHTVRLFFVPEHIESSFTDRSMNRGERIMNKGARDGEKVRKQANKGKTAEMDD